MEALTVNDYLLFVQEKSLYAPPDRRHGHLVPALVKMVLVAILSESRGK